MWTFGCPNQRRLGGGCVIMRALDPEVMDAVWAAAGPLLPRSGDDHPLGCHSPRIADRVCFEGVMIRLVRGCSWVTAERLLGYRASDTTLRARRGERVDAGVFDESESEALGAYGRVVGLDLCDACGGWVDPQGALRR